MIEIQCVNLRFGCVHWRVSVTNVLCTLEDAEGERGEEIARSQQTSGRAQRETGISTQEIVHLLQLWDTVLDEDSLSLELGEDHVVLAACVQRHQLFHDFEHRLPGVVLNFRVLDVGNRIAANDGSNLVDTLRS